MTPLVWMILLFCAGVARIIAEFFIPSAIAGIVGGGVGVGHCGW